MVQATQSNYSGEMVTDVADIVTTNLTQPGCLRLKALIQRLYVPFSKRNWQLFLKKQR